jgi:hypothetical protein
MPAPVAVIENRRRADIVLDPPRKGGQLLGEPIVIPAGVKVGKTVTPGRLEVATKAELEALRARLGKGLSTDGSTDLRLVGAIA